MSKYVDKSKRGSIQNGRYRMPIPRTHQNCVEVHGVARPGKTAVDKDRKARNV